MFIGNKVRKIKDSDFLRVKWERKEAAIKTAVHFLNEQAQSRSESKISENFPEYLQPVGGVGRPSFEKRQLVPK